VRRTQIVLSEPLHNALRERGFDERTSLGEQVLRATESYLGLVPQAPRTGMEREASAICSWQIVAQSRRTSRERYSPR
jgi:hypothetical protein